MSRERVMVEDHLTTLVERMAEVVVEAVVEVLGGRSSIGAGGGVVKGGGVVFGVVMSSLGEKLGGARGVVGEESCRGWCRLIVTWRRETGFRHCDDQYMAEEDGDGDAMEKKAICDSCNWMFFMRNGLN
ncbi:hypothetical protein Tco_0157681 [Tanacetum coccineum]